MLKIYLFQILIFLFTNTIICGEAEYVKVELTPSPNKFSVLNFAIDFKEAGGWSDKPIHNLKGIPEEFKPINFGYIELCAKEHWKRRYKDTDNLKYISLLGPDYDIEGNPDSKIDFIIGEYADEEHIIIDSNNDEDFSNEKINEYKEVYPNHFEIEREVSFQYLMKNQIKNRTVPIKITKSDSRYRAIVGEAMIGDIKLNEKDIPLALTTSGFGTYDSRVDLYLFFDLNENGKFENWESVSGSQGSFNLFNKTYTIDFCSADGMLLILKSEQESSHPDISTILSKKPIPDFELKTFNNSTVNLDYFKGKFLLLDFWGIWCGPCIQSFPKLTKLHNLYNKGDFEILGVLKVSEKERISDYKILFDSQNVKWKQIYSDELYEFFNVSGIPRYVLLSPTGEILEPEIYNIEEVLNKYQISKN